jgi:hypothetical protein
LTIVGATPNTGAAAVKVTAYCDTGGGGYEVGAAGADLFAGDNNNAITARCTVGGANVDVFITGYTEPVDTSTTVDQWGPSFGRNFSPRRPQRDNVAWLLRSVVDATEISQWSTIDWRQVRTWPPRRETPSETVQLFAGEPRTPDRWQPYHPTQYRLLPPRRDVVAEGRVYAPDASTVKEWQALDGRLAPLRLAQRDVLADLPRFLALPTAVSPDQWTPYRAYIQVPQRRPGRDGTAEVRVSGFEATSVCQWGPQGPMQFLPRRVQRDDTATVRLSGFEATAWPEWSESVWHVVPSMRRWHHDLSLVTTIALAYASSIDQWAPYGPTQYRHVWSRREQPTARDFLQLFVLPPAGTIRGTVEMQCVTTAPSMEPFMAQAPGLVALVTMAAEDLVFSASAPDVVIVRASE